MIIAAGAVLDNDYSLRSMRANKEQSRSDALIVAVDKRESAQSTLDKTLRQ